MRALDHLSTWPVDAAGAAVLVRRDGPGRPAGEVVVRGVRGEVERPFPWASVTKLCTALAVLVAVEEGTVALDLAAGPPGSTVAHLLAHASGLAPEGGVVAPPGRRRIYSNAGFEVLASTVAARADMLFADYLAEAVLEPLRMTARLEPAGSAAHGLSGPLADLVALGAELLAPTLLAPETVRAATTVAFPGLAGVLPGFGHQDPCDWGLGFELKDAKRPHWTGAANSPATFGHFGRAGGFVWVDPVAEVACVALTDAEFGPWARELWPALADAVLAEAAPAPVRG
jgi:CubicO group peptidase (beta-lactamase class C family)